MKYIFIVDIETTGLSLNNDVILEVGYRICRQDLEVLGENSFVIHHPKPVLDGLLGEFVREMHTQNKLLEDVEEATDNLQQTELKILEDIKRTIPETEFKLTPCGNNVHFDYYFLSRDMPKLAQYMDYRLKDLRAFESVAYTLNITPPMEYTQHAYQETNHRALVDVRHEYEALCLLRKHFADDDEHTWL
jgi:oligoribonuclease